MKKILFTATINKHILSFHLPFLKWFKEQGYEVHVAASGEEIIPYSDKSFNIGIERSPFKINENIKAYRKLKSIINDNNYSLIHCHTPMGGVLTRIAAKGYRKKGTKILYTAHGFHFFKGAPLKNWLLYYTVELWLSKHTDVLITINKEDYNLATQNKFKAQKIQLVNGVGVDLKQFIPQTIDLKARLRDDYGYNREHFILMYAGELSYRKHQDLLIDVVNVLKNKIPNIKLLLAGTGSLLEKYKNKVTEYGLEDNIEFLGYRNDISNLMILSDAAVSSSRQEGLPVNIMEAMGTGLPLVVTDCRGNRDLVINNKNGYVVGIDDVNGFAEAIKKLYDSEELRYQFRDYNLKKIEKYSIEKVMTEMKNIYQTIN